MVEPVALAALAIDAVVGWPDRIYRRIGHPVGAFAALVGWCEARWNRLFQGSGQRRLAGIGTVVLLIVFAGGTAAALEYVLRALLNDWAWLGIAALAAPGLAQRSLFDHVRAVWRALAEGSSGDARSAVAMIVGRDVDTLDEAGVSRAAIESLAESFCDGVVAPLFWLLVLGLPGIWIYKAINTADSLIGHREDRWRVFGWAAARSDDVLNLVPARLAAILLCLAGGGGWRVLWGDAHKHASPNAGWPEAAMAGALGVRLAGPIFYDGVLHEKPWIGDGGTEAQASDVARALTIYWRACAGIWLIAGAAAWAW